MARVTWNFRTGVRPNIGGFRRLNAKTVGRVSKQAFFTDTKFKKVGTPLYRAIRQTAFSIRKSARRSMLRKPARRFSSYESMPLEYKTAYDRDLRIWYAKRRDGKATPYPPKFPYEPSKKGTPPRLGRRKGLVNRAFGIWAAPASGNGPRSFRPGFLVGPRVFPNAKTNSGRVPGLHEQGGFGRASYRAGKGRIAAKFPKRPYMTPAYNRIAKTFPKKLSGKIKQFVQRELKKQRS